MDQTRSASPAEDGPAAGAARERTKSGIDRRSATAGALALLFGVALAAFFLFGSVTVEAGIDEGDRERVAALWGLFSGLLELRGLPDRVIWLVWFSAAVALAASVGCVWLALRAGDEEPGDRGRTPGA